MLDRRVLCFVLLFSALAVWSHWNFFSIGVYALGINFSVFWIAFALIFFAMDSNYRFARDWVWLVPIVMIALSYSFYEIPWLKLISLILLPIIICVFCTYSHFNNNKYMLWNSKFLATIGVRVFKPLSAIDTVFDGVFELSRIAKELHQTDTFRRVLVGFLILLPLAVLVVLLLSSADAIFSDIVKRGLSLTFDVINLLVLWKLFLSFLLAVALLSIAVAWSGVMDYVEPEETQTIDGLVVGIVLGGLLVIYGAFLLVQLDSLVVAEMPKNFREAELLVKTGFWQLFLLAVINTGLFFIVYRKTGAIANWILRVFIFASSLLMVSAAWKTLLYSYTFGLSYEKFFACYTALFALAVLLYLVAASFSGKRWNVVKTIAFAALWAYGIATISPIEKLIFHANLYLSEQDNTRIELRELTHLSMDIVGEVDRVLDSKLAVDEEAMASWLSWRDKQEKIYCHRAWYELNWSVVRGCR